MRLTQAILPLAGLGTRFLPWTKAVPKEMLPIGTKPIVALLVEECLDAGIEEICFVISRGKEVIPEYFRKDPALEAELEKRGKSHLLANLQRYDRARFHTVYQEGQKGDGHAILQAADWVKSDHVAVLFGDDLIMGAKSGLKQMMEADISQKPETRNQKAENIKSAILCLQDLPREKVSSYGIADVEPSKERLKRVRGLVEKPSPKDAPSTLGVVGKYILPRSIFNVLPKIGDTGEIRIIDALIASIGDMPIYGYVVEGKRYDTGTPAGYMEAVSEFLLASRSHAWDTRQHDRF